MASLGNNILTVCTSLTTAVREYYRMSRSDQQEVWDDMTGSQGQRRVFVQGKELPGFRGGFINLLGLKERNGEYWREERQLKRDCGCIGG